MEELIQGSRFHDMADWTYAPSSLQKCDYLRYPNTLDMQNVKDFDIIYTQGFTAYKKELLELVWKSDKPVILVSHNCDNNIDATYDLPDNVIRWYASNVGVSNPRIEAIPGGLENDIMCPDKHKKEKIVQKLNNKRNIRNLVYMDFTIKYNPVDRGELYDMLSHKTWVTTIHDKSVPFEQYIDNIYNHKFVLSPSGSGMATHRPWETLYLGSIPIEKVNTTNVFFKDLPICFVQDWQEITVDFLEREYIRIKNIQWNMDMLSFSWWENKIRNTR